MLAASEPIQRFASTHIALCCSYVLPVLLRGTEPLVFAGHGEPSHEHPHYEHPPHECVHDKFLARLKRDTHAGLEEEMRVRSAVNRLRNGHAHVYQVYDEVGCVLVLTLL